MIILYVSFFFFFKQKTAYEIGVRLVGSEMCIRDRGKRVLMVGDRNDDMRGAADCGLDAAGALYGYGSREELAPFHPVLLAESCADLAAQILD